MKMELGEEELRTIIKQHFAYLIDQNKRISVTFKESEYGVEPSHTRREIVCRIETN